MNDKEKFCQSLRWPEAPAIRWYDLVGIVQLDEGIVAKIELATDGTQAYYEGFRVRIASKITGTIDTKFFYFKDYLSQARRVDKRTADYKGDFHINSNIGWRWYISEPSNADTAVLTNAIVNYISEWA